MDGQLFWKLLLIEQNSKGDFYAFFLPSVIDLKYSRHASGRSHDKIGDQYLTRFPPKISLSEFKGVEQLKFMAVPLNHFTKKSSTVDSASRIKKKDAMAILNIRNFKDGIAVNPFIVEPENLVSLGQMLKAYKKGTTPYPKQVFIFTETKPWILLLIHDLV